MGFKRLASRARRRSPEPFHVFLGWILLVLLALPRASVLGACLTGDAPVGTPPAVSYLRGYWAGLRGPTRLAIDADQNLYVADPGRGTVLVRAPDGRVVSRFTGLGEPVGIEVDGAGRLLVGDAATGAVTAYGPDRAPVFVLGAGPGEFGLPGDIAHDPATGNIYVTDSNRHLVNVYGPGGDLVTSFGGLGSEEGKLNFPTGIAVDAAAGEVLVVDQRNARIQVFDAAGSFAFCIEAKSTATCTGGGFGQPPCGGARQFDQGITVDAAGRIYVADPFEGTVYAMDRNGAVLQSIGGFGRGASRQRVPFDVALDGFGRLFVADANNRRLQIYGIDGFTDPETGIPALVEASPDPIDIADGEGTLTVYLEVPGYRLSDIGAGTVAVNGTPVAAAGMVGDHDGDAEPDLRLEVGFAALDLPSVPGEPFTVTVTGDLSGMVVVGDARIGTISTGPVDSDLDGVPDGDDLCPGTGPGALVDGAGCSVAQRCPCAGPEPGAAWRNHGRYQRCVVDEIRTRAVPAADPEQRRRFSDVIRQAARSSCGRRG